MSDVWSEPYPLERDYSMWEYRGKQKMRELEKH